MIYYRGRGGGGSEKKGPPAARPGLPSSSRNSSSSQLDCMHAIHPAIEGGSGIAARVPTDLFVMWVYVRPGGNEH